MLEFHIFTDLQLQLNGFILVGISSDPSTKKAVFCLFLVNKFACLGIFKIII